MSNNDQAARDEDGRPPICPACGVTMGIRDDDGTPGFVCLECGFPDAAETAS